jgi:non-specific serine/threonine protein kinase
LQNAANETPSLIASQTNLPVPVTSFVGREKELKQISQRLFQAGEARLLTIVGPGGTGKTRLAIQSVRALVDQLSGGVWWVELSAVKDASLVAQAAAIALGLVESSGNSWLKQIITRLNAAPTLLVLDNCEHVLSACAELVAVLLHECPKLRILTTSREPLGTHGEITLPLSPFPLPSDQSDPSDFESVRLLLDRGRAVNASFTLTSDNTASVIQACRRLDGIPLAIELAAAQLNRLSIQQIVERLDDRFRLLVDGGLTSLPRHQTLQALIDWSHGLLALPERALFRRLAVFSGGWTLEAAIVVAGGYSWEQASEEETQSVSALAPLTVGPREMVRGLLEHLIEKSLVTVQLHGGERRYNLLENISLYARDKLIVANELAAIQARHFDYYLQLAKLAQPKLRSAEQLAWLKRLEAEHDNIRVALSWAQAAGGAAAYHGLQLSAALLWFWHIRGHRTEGFEAIKKLLTLTTSPPDPNPAWLSMRAHALHAAGRLTDGDEQLALFEGSVELFRQAGDMPGLGLSLATLAEFHCFRHKIDLAIPLLDQALPLLRSADDKFTLAQLHNNALGPMALTRGDYEQAHALQLEAASLRKALGDKDGLAWSLYQLGQVAAAQNDWESAQSYYEQTLPLWREVENHWLVQWGLNRLGFLSLAQKDAVKARQLFGEGLRSALAQGNPVGCALALNGLAGVALEQGQLMEAVRLLGALQVPFSDPEERWDADDFVVYQHQIAAAKNVLPDPEFSNHWKAGQELSISELAASVLGSG